MDNEVRLSDDDIKKVADKVVESLNDYIDKIFDEQQVGFLRGLERIGVYCSRFRDERYHPMSREALRKWHKEKGFPMNKDPNGIWWTTKTLLDSWMIQRTEFMRKTAAMNIKPIRPGRNGLYKTKHIQPELVSPEDKIRVFRAIAEDRARGSVVNE